MEAADVTALGAGSRPRTHTTKRHQNAKRNNDSAPTRAVVEYFTFRIPLLAPHSAALDAQEFEAGMQGVKVHTSISGAGE